MRLNESDWGIVATENLSIIGGQPFTQYCRVHASVVDGGFEVAIVDERVRRERWGRAVHATLDAHPYRQRCTGGSVVGSAAVIFAKSGSFSWRLSPVF